MLFNAHHFTCQLLLYNTELTDLCIYFERKNYFFFQVNSVISLPSLVEILSMGILLVVLIVSQKWENNLIMHLKKIETWFQETSPFTQLDTIT